MKDASATAIYGSRGANGVILITTKQAKEGKITVEYNASFGVQSLAKELELLDAWEYMSYLNEKQRLIISRRYIPMKRLNLLGIVPTGSVNCFVMHLLPTTL